MTEPARLRLVVEIQYDLDGTPIREMEDNLKDMVYHALGDGTITGNTPATVAGYHYAVEETEESYFDA
jgi:hypothetical protein